MNRVRSALAKLKVYEPGKSLKELLKLYGHKEGVKLASNENPYGSPVSPEELESTLKEIHLYPHQPGSPLWGLIATRLGVMHDQIVLGNGSDEILQMIAGTVIEPGDEAIVAAHTFSVYTTVVTLFGGVMVSVPMLDYAHHLEKMVQVITPKTKLIFICNPNNPTGTYLSYAQLRPFLKAVPAQVTVVLDEAYTEFVTDQSRPQSYGDFLAEFPNVIICRTFSKCYGLAGLRVGYALSSATFMRELNKIRPPFNVNSVALKAAELAYQKHSFVKKTLANNKAGLSQLKEGCADLRIYVIPSQSNFCCLDLVDRTSDDVFKALMKEGVITRSLTSFGLPHHLRVSVGLPEQNQRFLDALGKIIRSK